MSSSQLAPSSSVIELERLSNRYLANSEDAKSAVVSIDLAKQPVVVDADEASLERTGSRATTQVEGEPGERFGDRNISVEELPQRNISSLAPTDEGFNAYAFVSSLH